MKYKALNNSTDFLMGQKDLLETLLNDRGVEDVETFLHLTKDNVHDGMLFKNMEQALAIFSKWIELSKKRHVIIHVLVDQDCDGFSSGCTIINYIRDLIKEYNLNIEITYTIYDKKIHGIKLSVLENVKYDLFIIPDGGTNGTKECEKLKELNPNSDIIILDHHNIERENNYAIVVNCKDGQYPNSTLAGVGVVYKFIKEFDKYYNCDFADKYLDMVALGNIGDIMDLRDFETRYLTLQGIEKMLDSNKLLQEIKAKNEFSIGDTINITKVGWNITPLINAVTRVGTQEERDRVFRALLGEEETLEYQPRRKKKTDPKPPIELQSLQQYMARECTNIKSRQDRLAKKGMEELSEIIEQNDLNNDKIIIVEATDILDKDFTGLIANKLTDKYRKPVLILKSMNEEIFGGSGRNYRMSPIPDLNEFLTSLNVFEEVAGHDNSFGFKIKKENIELLKEKIREELKDVEMEDVHIVDYEIPVGRLKPNQVERVGQWVDIWGNTLREPLFAVTDIYINIEDVKLMGDKKNIIKIENKGLTFLFKHANEDMYNRIIHRNAKGLNAKKKSKRLKLTVIGKFTINKWNDIITPQIEVVDFESVEQAKVRF